MREGQRTIMGVISSTTRVLGTELRLSGLGKALPTGTPECCCS